MADISDSMLLTMLRALPSARHISAGTGRFWATFDREYVGQTFGQVEIEGRGPALTCRTSDVERLQLVKDTTLDIDGESYRVKRHEPDGTGISVLMLRK